MDTFVTDEQFDALFSGYTAGVEEYVNSVTMARELIEEMSPWDAFCYGVTAHCI